MQQTEEKMGDLVLKRPWKGISQLNQEGSNTES